jgi:formate hydrogenlyase subunit 3/multisubunit Na+/H+ antiporter MnhD subunit
VVQFPLYIAESFEIITPLPLWLVIVPLAGSFLIYLGGRAGERLRNCLAIGISACSFILAAILFHQACRGDVVYQIASFLNMGLKFRVDMLGGILLLLTSFIWLLATIFSWVYMEIETRRTRYYYFLTLALGGCLGVYLAEGFLGLLLFFELMSLASYVLVIHTETGEAIKAGRNYLYLCIISGLLILTGIFLLYSNAGTMSFSPLSRDLPFSAALRYLLAGLFISGFGIKAGMIPLHIWLPQAHPVAPSPISALLSGLMIKTGAYGIIRTLGMLFPPHSHPASFGEQAASLGLIIIWFGLATMFIAAFIALFQNDAKRVLAYSSISQMGYILLGLGCAACLGHEGSLGLTGSNYHIINHAFFKAGMFMMIGAVQMRARQVQHLHPGGPYRHLPVTSLAFLICACSLAGLPGFGGYASKTLLHHALEKTFLHHHFISLLWAEKILTLTGALTVCYITRLYTTVFLGKKVTGLKYGRETLAEKVIFAVIALVILLTGLFPTHMLKNILIPSALRLGYDPRGISCLTELNVLAGPSLGGAAKTLGLGLLIFFILSHCGAFAFRLPGWLTVEGLIYQPCIRSAGYIFTSLGRVIDGGADAFFVKNVARSTVLARKANYFDQVLLQRIAIRIVQVMVVSMNSFYDFWVCFLTLFSSLGKGLGRRVGNFLTKVDYNHQGREMYGYFNIMNFDYGLIMTFLFFMLIMLLGIFLA